MALTIWRFLEYFSVEELRFVLSVINEPQTGTRQELIERVIMEWPAHNKKWEELISYLDAPTLRQICTEYDLGNTGSRDLLHRRIKKQIQSKNLPLQKQSKKEKHSKQENKKKCWFSYSWTGCINWNTFCSFSKYTKSDYRRCTTNANTIPSSYTKLSSNNIIKS